MRAIRIHEHGGLNALRIDEIPQPKPVTHEVLVKIRAVAMNHMDLWVRNGMPGVKLPLPIILGCEASGVVEEVGSSVKKIKKGDEVVINPIRSCGECPSCQEGNDHFCPSFGLYGETEDGLDVEYKAVPVRNLIPKPEGLSFEEAAAIPVTFVTAWHMLIDKCGLQRGETVLVIAASSGVGSAAIQIAKYFGAEVIATAGSDEKIGHARELGADHVINHTTQDFSKEVKKLTDGRGVDIVFEHVGAATWEKSVRSLGVKGRLVTCGATTGSEVKINLVHLFIKHQQIIGSTMGPSKALTEIFKLAAGKKLHPVIDRVYSFEEVKEAHQRLEGRGQFGKIVLIP